VYSLNSGQFVIVVEGAPGTNGFAVGKSLLPEPPDDRPDLQIENTQDTGYGLPGNGSLAVCDTGPVSAGGGGIPGINPTDFSDGDLFITDALNDFACRFEFFSPAAPCTYIDATGDAKLVNSGATAQFCDLVSLTAQFPPGISVITAKLRDDFGNLGPAAQIVVRVATPTPTRTVTPTHPR
jgi:hypothetical protein